MGKIIGEGITFDDVLLVPAYSEVIPNQVELKTHLTKKIELNIPMMSAGMDTVTEHRAMKTTNDKIREGWGFDCASTGQGVKRKIQDAGC